MNVQLDTLQDATLEQIKRPDIIEQASTQITVTPLPEATHSQELRISNASDSRDDLTPQYKVVNTRLDDDVLPEPTLTAGLSLDQQTQDATTKPIKSPELAFPETDDHSFVIVSEKPSLEDVNITLPTNTTSNTDNTLQEPPTVPTESQEQFEVEQSTVKTDVYYGVLTVEQDDFIYLHHKDILSCTCTIDIQKLTQSDIQKLSQPDSHGIGDDHASPVPFGEDISTKENNSKTEDPDWPPKKVKKKSTRPGLKPSIQHIASQRMIEENKK